MTAPAFVPIAAVHAHVRALLDAGMPMSRIARLAAVDQETVYVAAVGRRPRCGSVATRFRRPVAERILAVRYEEPEPRTCTTITDATGTRRRLQALIAWGWPQSQLASRLGVFASQIHKWMRRPRVSVASADRVSALYDELWDRDPVADGVPRASVLRARRFAARNGWPPPMAWDDDTIDDPDAGPAEPEPEDRTAAIVEDAGELLALGCSLEDAARRLGVCTRTIERHQALARDAMRAAS